jgi:ABC-type amino acid transport substrate-binding protein
MKLVRIIILLLFVGLSSTAVGQTELVVGTKPAPPFVIKNDDGTWSGISIELWQEIAAEMEIVYDFEERSIPELLKGLEDGSLDIVAAAMTVTADRERVIDFTHPYYTTGLSIAAKPASGWVAGLQQLLSNRFLEAAGTLLLLLLIVGVLIWVAERRGNAEQFGGSPAAGIGSGVWWSAVTMTTVGYGDKAPRTVAGRILALIWMFAAIIIISGFTAAIASALTVGQLASGIKGPADLRSVRVGTVPSSTSSSYLDEHKISYSSFDTPEAALQALAEGKIDAVVYDAPILKYYVKEQYAGAITVLKTTFERQDYAFAVAMGSRMREELNVRILARIASDDWRRTLEAYLGT